MAPSTLAVARTTRVTDAAPRPPRSGFVLYVALDEPDQATSQAALLQVAETLGELAREWLPQARTRSVLSAGAGAPSHRLDDAHRTRRFDGTPAAHAEPPARSARTGLAPAAGSGPAAAPARHSESFRELLAGLPVAPQVHIDVPGHRVTVDGTVRRLTHQEFVLLVHLARRGGAVVSRDELHATVWNGRAVPTASRTVDVHIRRLREKLAVPSLITTVHRAGYRFTPPGDVRLTG